MSADVVLEGGCLCGAVRYAASATPIVVTHCHCTSCRRAVGAPMVTWATFPAGKVAFTRGAPIWYRSSAEAERGFCQRCGTSIAYRADSHPEEIDLTAGSLDAPERIKPIDHIWIGEKLDWLKLDDRLPQLAADHFEHGYPDGTKR